MAHYDNWVGFLCLFLWFSVQYILCKNINILQWRRKVPEGVGVGEGGVHRHVMYVPSVKNQYKRVVFGYMVI